MGIVAKYKYDGSVYADLIPEFNSGFTNYTITDEVDSENSNHIIRTIESDSLPTLMRFGIEGDNHADNSRQDSLLEILEMDTSALTTCERMFGYCKNLTNIECVWGTSNVDNMLDMFAHCQSLTKLDLSSFDTSDVVNMQGVFYNCQSLTKLDLSSFDTSNVVTMYAMFYNCKSLTKLDLSSFDTNDVVNMYSMISECYNLTSLDVSNFNTSNVTDIAYMLKNAFLLTDIGMLYCDQSTINKVASVLPTDRNITIWVESDDILQYDQYDHITYKTQKVQDTVHLNSPLLKGDTIEVIDGKTYHVHRWEKVVLNGSESWNLVESQTVSSSYLYQTAAYSGIIISENHILNILCDKMNTTTANENWNNTVLKNGISLNKYGNISIRCENITSVNDFKAWLSNNVLNIIAPLVSPYYELISEEPLELTLLDTADNTINNNSILPSNMTIANKELSTIAIKPSTTYTLSFDKSNEDSEVTIDICGGEQITTVLNRIELTTPSELGSGIRFISSDGCIISNVRLLEGSLVKEAIPKETFEGLKSSFEEGYIIGENLANDKEDYFYEETGNWGNGTILFKQNLKANTTYTLVRKISNIKYGVLNAVSFYDFAYYTDGTYKQDHNCWYSKNGWYISKYTPTKDVTKFEIIVGNDNSSGAIRPRITISDYMIFEGDHTHLSEAELMRYIEKGTSHYEEEDYNHVGKYKVQYKVTGKNKFDKDKELQAIDYRFENQNYQVDFNDDYIRVKYGLYGGAVYLGSIGSFKKGTYTISCECYSETLGTTDINIGYFVNDNWKHREFYRINFNTWEKFTYTFTLENDTDSLYLQFQASGSVTKYNDLDFRVRNIQIEEGTVATPYEPYKEDIKTYYLSSPLLKGDTIEDINGVATHVKRYGKVVLDGSETWRQGNFNNTNTISFDTDNNFINVYKGNGYCDRFINNTSYKDTHDFEYFANISNNRFTININKTKLSTTDINGFKQWLSENPTTIIYELASPIYEPISTESILCDSYVNGHLDFDSAVPIEKVVFRLTPDILNNYLLPSTLYTLKFDSDNSGIIDVLYLGGRTVQNNILVKKGVNTISFTLPNTLYNNKLHFEGIGFNISNIQVVATDRDIEFGYFKGLQSSFEDGLVTDETDENYGKYKVECKIVGKNKVNSIVRDMNHSTGRYVCSKDYSSIRGIIPLPIGTYKLSLERYNVDKFVDAGIFIWREGDTHSSTTRKIKMNQSFDIRDGDLGCTWYGAVPSEESISDIVGTGIQIEEGTQATSYEPYKESIHTLYLNSPLLKGDKLVVHDGKLCHYHKMGMVVLDGTTDWWVNSTFEGFTQFGIGNFPYDNSGYKNVFCDRFSSNTAISHKNNNIFMHNSTIIFNHSASSVSELKQWLQANPTTVVYELATPYYEPIEPQLSQYSFSTVKDGDMDIITVLPIEKINLTYRTDINGVSSIEEQIASIQEGTDISSIIDEEVDE